jgi:hypothetical protein
MGDVDAGNIKAKAEIIYEPGGLAKMKDDIKSLPAMINDLGDSTGSANDALSDLDKQMGSNAESAGTFSDAIEKLPKMIEGSSSAASEMTGVLSESQQAFKDTGSMIEETTSRLEEVAPSMQAITKQGGLMQEQMGGINESFAQFGDSWGTSGNNIQAFQQALASPDSFQVIDEHLNKTGQGIEEFTSSIGGRNADLFHQMSMDWSDTNAFIDTASSNFESVGKSASEGFGAVSASAADADKAVSEFLGTTSKSAKATGSVSLGGAFGEAFSGVTGFLNDIAMPLMAVQMIGMAVQAAGQAIYDSAVIAEGPAAHSLGTFTGTVDALGQSIQKVGGQFSESFGQQIMPTLNALNYQASNGDLGGVGGFLGGVVSTIANLTGIFTFTDIPGGMEGLANQWAQLTGQPQPYQGPGPEEQAQVKYQQSFATMPQTVRDLTYQSRTQSDQLFQMASDPGYLQSQDEYQAAQQAYQTAQRNYNSRNYISPQQALMHYQEQQYDQQQMQNYAYQQQNPTYGPVDIPGYWGGVGQSLGLGGVPGGISQAMGAIGDFFNSPAGSFLMAPFNPIAGIGGVGGLLSGIFGGGGGPQSSAFDSLFGGNGMGAGGFGNWIGGIGQNISNLFGGAPEVPATTYGGGCFIAGTQVLMADGTSKPIEMLQAGENVLAHDGRDEVVTTVLARIIPPPKQVYELIFSDGSTLTLTDSHPIATPLQGWKAISPEAAKQENPDLTISPLVVGDSVCMTYGICTLVAIQPREIVQVYNITVDEPHTFYANGVLVHNKVMSSMSSGGTGSEQVSLSHTFTANVTWAANNLEKSFTAAAQWAGQNLAKTFQGIASWVGQGLAKTFNGIASWVAQGLANTFNAVASWVGQGLSNTFNGIASWVGQGLSNTFNGVASWVGQGLQNTFNGVASWVGQGLQNTFRGVASWVAQGLEHTFNAVAQWTAQNLTPNFTVNPSFTMLAEGTSNWGGGPAVVGESGLEMVESNGQYTLFDQGAALVNLPAGSNVYPMKDLTSYSSPTQFADGTGGGTISLPIDIRGQNANMPQSMNIYLQVDGQTFWSATGVSFAQNARVQSGMRSY